MTIYLLMTLYDTADGLAHSDQITIPESAWTILDSRHSGTGPIFLEVGEHGSGVFGRARPAVSGEGVTEDVCRLPLWMWVRLGCPDVDTWVGLTPSRLPEAGRLVLRARKEADVLALEAPEVTLAAELSGSGSGHSWSCLSVGAELPLSCGVFDIMEIYDVEGAPVASAAILNVDVALDFVPALDHVRPPTPPPSPPAVLTPAVTVPAIPSSKFIPFSGKGYRLGDS